MIIKHKVKLNQFKMKSIKKVQCYLFLKHVDWDSIFIFSLLNCVLTLTKIKKKKLTKKRQKKKTYIT